MSLNIHIRRNSKPRKLRTVRIDRIEIRNQTDGLYYTFQCKTVDGVPVLVLSDSGKN